MKYPYQCLTIYTIVNWQVSSFKLDPWNMAKSRLVIFASNIIIKSNILLEGREIIGHSQCSNLKWYLPLNFLKKKLWKLYTWVSFKLCSNLLLLSQILFNEDLSSNQVRYFTTIRMIITNKRITATKAMMAFILHLRHHICLRSCLDLLLKAVALSDNRGSAHRGWREGLNDITGFFYLICPVVHLVSPLFLLPL